MMKKSIALLVAAVCSAATLFARSDIKDIDISIRLHRNGTASVTESWNVNVSGITEWYLVRGNLGDIEIRNLSVTENGRMFENEGSWDIDRNIRQKAFKCGIVDKGSNGCELCWGVGSDGEHIFTVSYDMTNAVKSLYDYDILHLQTVSPGLSSRPEHVRVRVGAPVQIDSSNTRIWGFGYEGTSAFDDGCAVFESDRRFSSNSSVIVLLRFDKGIFESESIQARGFDDVWEVAVNGSSFGDESSDENDVFGAAVIIFELLFFFFFGSAAIIFGRNSNKLKPTSRMVRKLLGIAKKDISWCRDIPYGGNLIESNYIAQRTGENSGKNSLAAALILRMIQRGQIIMKKDAKDRVELYFSDSLYDGELSDIELKLVNMMRKAAGSDGILQDKEFSRWSKTNFSKVNDWIKTSNNAGKASIAARGHLVKDKLVGEGIQKARELVGFRKYLQDFTLLKERHTQEVALWQDYLCFAALFGIAEQVAEELKDIDPQVFEEVTGYDFNTVYSMLRTTRLLSAAITNSQIAQQAAKSSSGGFGGRSSFGGGGGFSGGGRGGGGR